MVQIGEILHQARIHQLIDDLLSQPVDIHGVTAGEMNQRLFALARTCRIHAAVGHLVRILVNAAAAIRAARRHHNRAPVGALLDDLEDVRDHFPGALDQHRIADLKAQPLDLVHVVQRRAAHGDAADGHRLNHRRGRQHACAPHAENHVLDDGRLLPRRILVRDGPPRSFGRESEFLLQRDFVDLDHDAIDLVRQLLPLAVPLVAVLLHVIDRLAQLPVLRRFESQLGDGFEHLRNAAQEARGHPRAGNSRRNRAGATP